MKDSPELMGSAPIPWLILRFALPAMVGVIANALYNIVDRIFIGHYVGAPGLAAISIIFPIVLAVVAFSALIGVGTASQISRALGAGKQDVAQLAFGNGIFASLVLNASMVCPLLIWLPEAVRLCGATEHIAPLTETYLGITGPFIPIQFLSMVLMSSTRAQGHPRHAMWGVVFGSLLNVILDWWFIGGLGMGVAGAAWATSLSQTFAFVWVASFYARKKGVLRVLFVSMKPSRPVLFETLAVGVSPFLINISFAALFALFNLLLGKYGGEIAISAMGVVMGVDSLLYMPVTGIGEGAMPVIGFNFGAKKFDRLRRAVKIALIISVSYYILSEAVAVIWPEKLAALFTADNPELIALVSRNMRIGYAALPFGAISIVACFTFEALGRARTAFLFNIARQTLAIILLFVLAALLGVDGVWLSLSAVDVIGAAISICLLRRESRNWH